VRFRNLVEISELNYLTVAKTKIAGFAITGTVHPVCKKGNTLASSHISEGRCRFATAMMS
jgi:hypothetical protein